MEARGHVPPFHHGAVERRNMNIQKSISLGQMFLARDFQIFNLNNLVREFSSFILINYHRIHIHIYIYILNQIFTASKRVFIIKLHFCRNCFVENGYTICYYM